MADRCPRCHGVGEIRKWHKLTQTVEPCAVCEGDGWLTGAELARYRRGQAHYFARMNDGRLLVDVAAALGCDPRELADWEWTGHTTPALLAALQAAGLEPPRDTPSEVTL